MTRRSLFKGEAMPSTSAVASTRNYGTLLDQFMTFTTGRQVSICHYKIGAIMWIMRIVTTFFVCFDLFHAWAYFEACAMPPVAPHAPSAQTGRVAPIRS